MIRLKLTAPLHSRDGTLAKGGKMKNIIAEVYGDKIKAMKRPGVTLLIYGSAMQGQGVIGLNGVLYSVSNDTLRKIIVSPPSASAEWEL